MTNLRVFFIGGYLSYRALFNWMHWSYYIPTMLGAPVFQVLFFAYIGRFAQIRNDEGAMPGQLRRYLVPCDVSLGIPVQQQQRRTHPPCAQVDLHARGDLDAPLGEAGEQVGQRIHAFCSSRSSALQPMSERQKPPGQSILATAR